jgi:glutamyl-tRNA reductase
VEVYGLASSIDDDDGGGTWRNARRLMGAQAVRHATSVAIGLESAVLAEDQVLHQLRADVTRARRSRALPPHLHVLFDAVLRAGRLARSWRPAAPRSLADLAVDRVVSASVGHGGAPILVVGAGEMGRLAARAASARGCPVVVASRTRAHADEVAATTGAHSIALEDVEMQLASGVRGVVVAIAGPWRLALHASAAVHAMPAVVDLSVPSALPSEVVAALGERFTDVDALVRLVEDDRIENDPTGRFRRRLEALRDRTVEEVAQRLAGRAAADVRSALAGRIERERTAELDALWRSLPTLPAADRAAIDGMTRHLAKRLLGEPLARLGADPDGRRALAIRELFDL